MPLVQFIARACIYLLSFAVSWFALDAVNYEKILKTGHVKKAQILYFLLVAALAYLVGSFCCAFLYQ
ncbi:MAG: DUF1146 domain-containing protein [Solobacterium sp.]|jgi:uncharacterized integral membrane protein (TIGR02327 family)|nr:DUF1146 domain-containing protein [Solobacterium sp.]MCH4206487.1 DUF1146 domain-containing protein [Solobacterium sp.]MCH4282814.1 DUF1146 domain-containing protein [Solobacterium sp.]